MPIRPLRLVLLVCLGLLTLGGARPSYAEPAPPDRVPFGPPPQYDLVGDMLGRTLTYRTKEEDTLLDVARRFNIGYVEMINANPKVDHWLPGEGTPVVIPAGHLLPDAPRRGIVINLADLRLYYFAPNGRVLSFAIGSGRQGYRSPHGTTTVVRKQERPTWYPTPSERRDNPDLPAAVPPGPDNPLGAYGMYLGFSGYIIHGTNNPWGVGRQISRGCFHLYPEGIATLFPMVPIGTPVTIVNQTVKLGWSRGQLWLEVHPTQDQMDQIENDEEIVRTPIIDLEVKIAHAAGNAFDHLDWDAIRRAAHDRNGVPVAITPVIADKVETTASADADKGVSRTDPASVPPLVAVPPVNHPSGLY